LVLLLRNINSIQKSKNEMGRSKKRNGVFMKIELMPLDQVLPYARNPRINAHAVEKVAASIKEFGFRQPIVVDGEMVIVVGHVRYEAAKRLGLKKVPVHIATDLTPEQIKAYRITDNRVGEESEWDKALLQLEIVELEEAAFSADLLGFNDEELRDIKASVDGLLEDGFGKDDDDDIEEADTTARIGGYTFPIPREQYLEWLEALKQSVGFEKKEIIAELKRRLGL
jgi:ParB-like chromosome segregation protein Spo0J